MERDHRAPLPLGHELDRPRAETRGEDPVSAGGRTTPLQVPEQHAAGFLAGRGFEIRREPRADPAQPLRRRGGSGLLHDHVPPYRPRTLRRDHDAETRAQPLARQDQLRQGFETVRDFGDHDDVGAAGDAGVQRNPSRVTAHDLHDHDSMVGFRAGVQPVDGVGREADSAVEPERAVGLDNVVVDGLGNRRPAESLAGETRGRSPVFHHRR